MSTTTELKQSKVSVRKGKSHWANILHSSVQADDGSKKLGLADKISRW